MNISIIIPLYNTEMYLVRCLDSVLAQSFEDWECLLIDDGSTDQSGRICDSYSALDKRFKVFHTVNSGVSAARNLGIKHSLGTYIAFIDSDDWIDQDYLYELYNPLEDTTIELTICGMQLHRNDGVERNLPDSGEFIINTENSDKFVDLNRRFLLYSPCVKLYRSDIIKAKNIRFPVGIHFGEDLIFNFDYLEYVNKITVVGVSGYNYWRANSGTLSTSVDSRQFANNYTQWNIIKSFFERRGIDSKSAKRFLSNRIWGIAYDLVMSEKLSIRELNSIFSKQFATDLANFNDYSITIPRWLRVIISYRFTGLIYIVQRR